jgi:hypothetical protein
MPLSDLLQRLAAALDVRLVAEGEDVADQKIDLVTWDIPAADTLTAIVNLLNAEGPKGYRWERSGQGPEYRYVLVRDLASRQWGAQQAAAAERRLEHLLRARLAALANEPFRPDPARPRQVPGMQQLLSSLSGAQVARLVADRYLILTAATCDLRQQPLFKELMAQAATSMQRRRPDTAAERNAQHGPPEKDPGARAEIFLVGDAPQYIVKVGVKAAHQGGISEVCRVEDTESLAGDAGRRGAAAPLPVGAAPEPIFALPPRASWRMGDVLADIAARAHLNLIADDYTQAWAKLERLRGAQPLSVWLAAIRDDCGCAVERDGAFLRIRNRRWWLDQRQEIPPRLLTRWAELARGTPRERLQAAGEIARWAPLSPGYAPLQERLRTLMESPELRDRSPDLVPVAALMQTELLIYHTLPPSRQQQVTGPGLTLTASEIPPECRALFARRVQTYLAPGLSDAELRRCRLFMQFSGVHLVVRWALPSGAAPWEIERDLTLRACGQSRLGG